MRSFGLARTMLAVAVAWGCLAASPLHAQRRGPRPEVIVRLAHEIIREVALRDGIAEALPRYLMEESALLWPGLPIVTGRERIAQVLVAQGILAGTELELRPMHLIVSDDESAVVAWGTVRWRLPDSTRGETGQYLASWHRVGTAWRIGALALVNLLERGTPGWPPALASPRGDEVVLLSEGRGRAMAEADLAFADSAGRSTASAAFAAWAAGTAVTFDGSGLLHIGPAQIAAGLAGLDGAAWQWAPVAAGAAEDGSVGWTAGEATITVPPSEDQPEGSLFKGTYLTLWQRQPDGSLRFIADGGGSRP